MKDYIIILLSLLGILLSLNGCSDNSLNGGSNEPNLQKAANILNVQEGAGLVYRNAMQETGDTLAALEAMGQWIGNHEAVKEAWYHDLESIRIHYKNGLKSSIQIVKTDETGVHLSRGGGVANVLKEVTFSTQTKNQTTQKIKNEKVLILIPYTAEFGYGSAKIADLRKSFGSDFQVDIITDKDVSLDDVDIMSDYGFIILDTHGQKHGFYMGKLERTFSDEDPEMVDSWTPENTKRELFDAYNIPTEKVENGEIEITQNIEIKKKVDISNSEIVKYDVKQFTISVIVTENYIRNANIDLTDAIVFGNHCYSGHTADGSNKNNMSEAWRSKGAAAYYGYAYDNGVSIPVDNGFALGMEKALIKRLVVDTDTTGTAHLKEDGTRFFWDSQKRIFRDGLAVLSPINTQEIKETKAPVPFYFNQYFDKNYSYGCGTFTDPLDGEVYKLACIGDQIWFAQNLRYSAVSHKVPEGKDITKHGYLYDYDTAGGGKLWREGEDPIQGICPAGWHIPHRNDWSALLHELGSNKDNVHYTPADATARKTVIRMTGNDPNHNNYQSFKDDPELNESGFTALATGYGFLSAFANGDYVYDDKLEPSFWSSSALDPQFDQDSYWFFGLDLNAMVYRGYNFNPDDPGNSWVSLRCIKTKEK